MLVSPSAFGNHRLDCERQTQSHYWNNIISQQSARVSTQFETYRIDNRRRIHSSPLGCLGSVDIDAGSFLHAVDFEYTKKKLDKSVKASRNQVTCVERPRTLVVVVY
jgi:hypothetical protein